MPNSETVQILLAAYNNQAFIVPQVRSILDQTHPDLSILIRDDRSTDQTPARAQSLAAEHPRRVRVVSDDNPNLGARGNFARLLDLADPGYVMFSDADDLWLPDKVARSLDLMRRIEAANPPGTPVLVHTDLRVVDADLRPVADSFCRYQFVDPIHGVTLNRLLVQNVVTGCTMMLNAALVELARPVPPDAVMHDWWIALVAAALGVIGFVPEATMLYRQHGGNSIGAKAWGPRRIVRRTAAALVAGDEFRALLGKTQRQAAALHERFGPRLAEPRRELVAAYAGLSEQGWLARRRTIFHHRLFKSGLAPNIGMLLAV